MDDEGPLQPIQAAPQETRIALIIGTDATFGRNIVRGIISFKPPLMQRRFGYALPHALSLRGLKGWRPTGVIAHLTRRDWARELAALGVPVVNTSNALKKLSFPRIGINDIAVGELAARHFLERGFQNFAFVAEKNRNFSVQREAGFRAVLKNAGYACNVYRDDLTYWQGFHTWKATEGRDVAMQNWLRSLRKPVGLFVPNDYRAWYVADLCHASGLRVPDELALIGVDNDEMYCEISHPPLSSIAIPSERIGYEAAALLERLLAGKPPPKEPLLLEPLGIVARQSSDILAMQDRELATALRFIREHAREPITVESVLQHVPISRRSLERRFEQTLGRTPFEEIRRIRVELAKELLIRTDLSMPEIARQTGFYTAERLSVVLKQELGVPPTAFRRQTRIAR